MLIFSLSNNLFVIMAEKRTSHIVIGTVSGCSSGRVMKKRGKGHRLSSQAKYIVNSVREFFEKKAKQKATLHDQVVKRTAAACGIGVTTVIRLHEEYGDSGGKHFLVQRRDMMKQEYNLFLMKLMWKVFLRKCMSFIKERSIPR